MQTCAKCKKSLPSSAFKRLLTFAETKARGKKGEHRMAVQSKYCKDCRPKRKPTRKLSTREIRNKVVTGDLHPLRAGLVLRKRQDDLNAKKSHGRRKAWDDARAKLWTACVLKPMSTEIERANAKRCAAKPDGQRPDPELLAFWGDYHAMLHDLRDVIKGHRVQGIALPKVLTEYIKSQWLDNQLALHGVARRPTVDDLVVYFNEVMARARQQKKPEDKWAQSLWTLILTEQQRTDVSRLWQSVALSKRGRLSTPTALTRLGASTKGE